MKPSTRHSTLTLTRNPQPPTPQPFDTFKVRQQTAGLSIPHTLKNILSESPAAFWKGVVPTTAGMMFENAMGE